ncbi:hypothetical protein XI02_42265 [Bradyrhizobium sp. CCBAU 21365]|uniref:hypothetical protein n=1 Tax=Bradyrhizobium sp. CCBAU 21365 TaxID=1325083 RepID=UPI00188C0340|nr:hypothetical protein [Bradyrhizobium sp. CCBAU 21365]QOZ20841.1 hypothetical protein XI02_42265 [Bradyrhizobium sp. CCBAU 21365]
MPNFDVTRLNPSFSIGRVRADVTYKAPGKFTVSLYQPDEELSHAELLCAIKVLKRAERFVAGHVPSDGG